MPVNVNLGRQAMYPEDLGVVAHVLYEAVGRARAQMVDEGEVTETLAMIDELLKGGRAWSISVAGMKQRPPRVVIWA